MSYSHPFYAQSLREFGQPLELPRCGGWILVRPIAGTPYKDAMGCYPLFSCQDWTQIHKDLEEVGHEWVSLTLVTDPFGGYEPDDLRRCFPDVMVPFKEHFVADLCRPMEEYCWQTSSKECPPSAERGAYRCLRGANEVY